MELNTRVSKTKISQMMVGKLAKHRQQTFPFQKGFVEGYDLQQRIWLTPLLVECPAGWWVPAS